MRSPSVKLIPSLLKAPCAILLTKVGKQHFTDVQLKVACPPLQFRLEYDERSNFKSDVNRAGREYYYDSRRNRERAASSSNDMQTQSTDQPKVWGRRAAETNPIISYCDYSHGALNSSSKWQITEYFLMLLLLQELYDNATSEVISLSSARLLSFDRCSTLSLLVASVLTLKEYLRRRRRNIIICSTVWRLTTATTVIRGASAVLLNRNGRGWMLSAESRKREWKKRKRNIQTYSWQ